jgi:CRP-like cAMP-binding protein
MHSSPTPSYDRNGILAALPAAEIEQLTPHLHPVLLHHGDVLCETHAECEWVYFPKAGVISVVVISQEGTEVEAGTVGYEGVVGVAEAMSRSKSLGRFTAQSALCNRLHPLESRLARWLLTVDERVEGQSLELTHEFIGTMLGTRRVGVTEALGTLRNSGLIETQRGCITILDREGLKELSCECYQITHDFSKRSAPKT